MKFCQEMHWTRTQYMEEDAAVILRWGRMLSLEGEALGIRAKLKDARRH